MMMMMMMMTKPLHSDAIRKLTLTLTPKVIDVKE